MKSNASILASVFLISIILCSALITNVSASTEIALGAAERSLYTYTGYSGLYVLKVDRPQLRMLSHSSGKTIILSMDSASNLYVKVISSTGIILANTKIILLGSTYISGSVAEYDANNVIITCGESILRFSFIIFNINTFIQARYSIDWNPGGNWKQLKIGQLYYYNGVWWNAYSKFDSYVQRNSWKIDIAENEDDVDVWAVFSDGVDSFKDKDKTLVPSAKVICDLMDFKGTKGEFVKRRMNGFLKKAKKQGWSHHDDVSMAAICI